MILSISELPVLINIIILLSLSAFFSASETSFTSLSLAKTEVFITEKRWGWKKVKYITDNIDRCIITCLIMNNLVNIIITAYLTITATRLFGVGKGITIAVLTGAILILLLGSIIPKRLAIQHTEKVAQITAYFLWITVILLTPITLPLMKLLHFIWPSQKTKNGEIIPDISEDEIRAMVHLGEQSGAINHTSQDFLQNVFTLPKKHARDIMTPLEKVISLPITSTIEEFQEASKKNSLSRIPVFTESLNDKNIFLASLPTVINSLGKNPNVKKKLSKSILSNMLKIPESIIIQDLLVIFQNKNQHVALVVNEDQETIGLISLEDIMDVVFGEGKEGVTNKKLITAMKKKKSFEIHGEMTLETLAKTLEITLPEKFPSHKTVAWLCMDILGRFPQKNDGIKIPDTNIFLLILNTKNKKAQKVVVQIKENIKK